MAGYALGHNTPGTHKGHYQGTHKGCPYDHSTFQPFNNSTDKRGRKAANNSTSHPPMEILLDGTRPMLAIAGACIFFVILSMVIDLISGLYKARQRGELRSSYGLSRTVSKFILYSGSVIIALMIDVMIHYSRLFVLMHLQPIVGVPIVTCLMSIFLCVIEFLSIREKAEEKTIKDMDRLLRVLADVVGRDRLRDILATRIDHTVNDRPS